MRRRTTPTEIEVEYPRTCLFCEHFYIDMATRGYSEMTPGSEFDMDCTKNKWTFDRYGSEAHYRGCLVKATTCQDYQFNPRILVEIQK